MLPSQLLFLKKVWELGLGILRIRTQLMWLKLSWCEGLRGQGEGREKVGGGTTKVAQMLIDSLGPLWKNLLEVKFGL